jgi:2-hydroxychromene-2-carboxylate isomerase
VVLEVMKIVGNTPTTITCGGKRQYAGADLTLWARRYGVPIAYHPQLGSLDGAALLRVALAAEALGVGRAVIEALFNAVWRDRADLSPAGVLALLA